MSRFGGLRARIREIWADRYVATPVEHAFAARFDSRNHARGSGPHVLVQNTEDKFFYLLFAELISGLRLHGPLQVEQYVARGLRPDGFNSLRAFIRTRLYWNVFTDRKWEKLYRIFCERTAWRAGAMHWPWQELGYALRAWRAWRSFSSKDALSAFAIDGVRVGDLVIDTYLRFNSAPEVRLRDPALFTILRQAYRDMASAQRYFRRHRPALFITSYTVYLQHGVAVRVAARRGVPVISFGNLQEFGTWITPDHLCHTKRDYSYYQDFQLLPDPDERIARADRYLAARLSGAIDPATAYMKTSAYAVTTTEVPDARGAAVVFLHDFFDSANVYRNMVFADFWEWLDVTVRFLDASGQPFFIKPHPNQSPESTLEMERFIREHPSVRVIPSKVTNAQLVQAGMVCGITVYGTVVSELAFLGVPSICCSDNPFVSFDFCRTARSLVEYREFLRDIPNFMPDKAMMRRQACIFDYMHNLDLGPEEEVLRDAFVEAWMRTIDLHRASEQNPKRYFACFEKIAQMPAFRAFVARLYDQLTVPDSVPSTNPKVIPACSPMHRS